MDALWFENWVSSEVATCTGTEHNLVLLSCCPRSSGWLLRVISTAYLVNTASQPASHSCPIESRECGCRLGNKWAIRADTGIIGI
jgi:hypothetical protein